MKKGLVITLITMLFSVQAFSCGLDGSGFMPENDMRFGVNDKNANKAITKEVFDQVLDRIEEIYAPDFARRGKRLNLMRLWNNDQVNAQAIQSGNEWQVKMFGGMARHPHATADAFATVACHEIGHHIGGAPKVKVLFITRWASNEGQSDYFATSKCMRKYMEVDDNEAIVAQMDVPQSVTDRCEAAFANANEIAMCQRSAMAGLALAKILAGSSRVTPNFATPDTSRVRSTNHMHPEAQCRLDTYVAGALCDKSETIDPSGTNPKTGYCVRTDGYTEGVRPLCWYRP